MANKYTHIPVPSKEEIEKLYNENFMTQIEIGKHFGVSQKVVFGWFKKLNIKSRVAYKRNQTGENNSSWKGNNATYTAYHYRVRNARGKADHCEVCGRDDNNISYDWANMTKKYEDVNDYKMMCRSCHFKMDGHKKNFPNSKHKQQLDSRSAL